MGLKWCRRGGDETVFLPVMKLPEAAIESSMAPEKQSPWTGRLERLEHLWIDKFFELYPQRICQQPHVVDGNVALAAFDL